MTTDRDWGDGEGTLGEKRGRAIKKNVHRVGKAKGWVGLRVGGGSRWGGGMWWGEYGDNCT